MLTNTVRLEFAPFGIKGVGLKPGVIKSNLNSNMNKGTQPRLPEQSIYYVARDVVEKSTA